MRCIVGRMHVRMRMRMRSIAMWCVVCGVSARHLFRDVDVGAGCSSTLWVRAWVHVRPIGLSRVGGSRRFSAGSFTCLRGCTVRLWFTISWLPKSRYRVTSGCARGGRVRVFKGTQIGRNRVWDCRGGKGRKKVVKGRWDDARV